MEEELKTTEESIDDGITINQLEAGTCFHLWNDVLGEGEDLYLITKIIEKTPEAITFQAKRIHREYEGMGEIGNYKSEDNAEVTIKDEDDKYMVPQEESHFNALNRLVKANCDPRDGDIYTMLAKELFEITDEELSSSEDFSIK